MFDYILEASAVVDFARRREAQLRGQPTVSLRDLNSEFWVEPDRLVRHLDNYSNVRRYQRKCDEISTHLGPGAKVLDWGSFYGQMTYLLVNRGIDAVPFDISANRLDATLGDRVGRSTVYSDDGVGLPFGDATFDGVLSSGTLEHVLDPDASMAQIRRVVKPGGLFFVYNLPNRYSWAEFLSRRMNSGHARLYRPKQVREWFRRYDLEVVRTRSENFLPNSLSLLRRRSVYTAVSRYIEPVDWRLAPLPPMSFLATNLTIIARRLQ